MNEDNKIFKTNEFSIEVNPVENTKQVKNVQYFSYDENSGLQLIHILMDGKPLDLPNGTEIRLSAVKLNNQNQKLIYTPEIVNPLNGIVSFVIPREFLGYQGRIRCGLYINFSNNQTMHVGYFYINMGVSDIDTNLTEFTEDFWQGWSEFEAGSTAKMKELEAALDGEAQRLNEHANQKITEYDQYIASGKSDWEDFVNQNREIIESVDPGGRVLTELIDSRKSGGIVYPSLSDRLNNTDRQNNLVKSRLFFGDNNVLIGHRGCSGFAPENSKKAFELAYYQGMAGIETDLTNTTDGVIFCYHDETLDTKTDGTGNPRELTWDYVSTVKLTKAAGYDAYPNTKIATLDDYLSVAKKYNLIIFPEVALSTEDLIHEALDKIYLYGLQSQCVILVNKWNYQIVKSYAPNLIRCLIPSWGVANTDDIDFCATNGIEICGAAFSAGLTAVPQSFIDYANEKGIYLYGYIINATKDLSRIKDLGIKFIGTDVFGGDN